MIVNQAALLFSAPIKDMLNHKAKSHGVSYGMSEAGYDIRLKQDVIFNQGPDYVTVWDPDNEHHESCRGRFALASAIEEFDMPDNLVGIVHDKSTWARQGLSVFNTCIESGWRGHLTLELVYHGNKRLYIPAGSGIAQVVFHKVSCPIRYTGKYQNQKDRPVQAIAS